MIKTQRTYKVRENILNVLQEKASTCTDCKLHKTRTNVVFGSGHLEPKIVIVGEAPGADEDAQGLPFVGRAGKLLDEMLKDSGLKREDVYILNTVKCRPPGNRKPENDEMQACRSWLQMQIETLQPMAFVTLGATATEAMCGPGEGITKRRGFWELYYIMDDIVDDMLSVIPVMPTLHPAYVLRNPSAKSDILWDLNETRRRVDNDKPFVFTDKKTGEDCMSPC